MSVSTLATPSPAPPAPGPGDAALLATDRERVWHPYAPMPGTQAPLLVRGAEGARLRLADGREVLDGMASWWAAVHGYRHPVLDAALARQLGEIAHVMFGGLTHEPAIRLADRLAGLTGLDHVFFADSGSVGVEVAMKMALQAAAGRGEPRRTRLATLRGGYHGDTFGAMSLSDPVTGMHHLFGDAVQPQVFLPRPEPGFDAPVAPGWERETRAILAAEGRHVAAIVLEPVLQGAGGMFAYSPAYVRLLRELADEHGALLVLDEIATGFWRTGRRFAADHAGVRPDVLTVGKALTGGYLTLAATLCTREVAAAIGAGGDALMHGPTYMANPLACAVASASIDLLESGDTAARVAAIERGLAGALAPAAGLPSVVSVRTLGAVGVIELDAPVDMTRATAAALDAGVWLRPFGRLVYAMPPYVCTGAEVERIGAAMVAAAVAGR